MPDKLKESWNKINEMGLDVYHTCREHIINRKKENDKLATGDLATEVMKLQADKSLELVEQLSVEQRTEILAAVVNSSCADILHQSMRGTNENSGN